MYDNEYPAKDHGKISKCGDFCETRYFMFVQLSEDTNADICYYCDNDMDIVSTSTINKCFNLGGKMPIPLCVQCFTLNIEPTTTDFGEKYQMAQIEA